MLFRVALFALVCEASESAMEEAHSMTQSRSAMEEAMPIFGGDNTAVETKEPVPVENLTDMAPAEETVAATATWDKARRDESIGRLMQSATSLMKSQTTPQVAEFTKATIEAIEDEALPAIRDEHKLDKELVLKEFAAFKDIGTKRSVAENAIAGLEETEQTQTAKHKSCRAAQQIACDISKKCNRKLAALKKTWDKKEELLAVSSDEIEGTWCKGDVDDQKLEKSFYKTNEGYFKQYIKRKKEAEAAWIAQKDKTPICEGFANTRKAKQSECDGEQDTLQERSCARASFVREANGRVHHEWKVAKGIYKHISRRVLSAAEDRKKEWVGIHTVKCLLESLKENAELSEPCDNTTHAKKVSKQIESCHDLAEDDTHLTIEPPVVPPTPKRFKLHPAPCMKWYAKWMRFAKLPKCAQAKACTRSCQGGATDDYRAACENPHHRTLPGCTQAKSGQCNGQVRLGHGARWTAWKPVHGRFDCTNAFFGHDPARGQAKECTCRPNVAKGEAEGDATDAKEPKDAMDAKEDVV